MLLQKDEYAFMLRWIIALYDLKTTDRKESRVNCQGLGV